MMIHIPSFLQKKKISVGEENQNAEQSMFVSYRKEEREDEDEENQQPKLRSRKRLDPFKEGVLEIERREPKEGFYHFLAIDIVQELAEA